MNDCPKSRPNDHPNGLSADDPIPVGSEIGTRRDVLPVIRAEDPVMRAYAGRPWLRAYVARETRSPYFAEYERERDAVVSDFALGHHAMVVGAIGSGKTRLAIHLISEQIRRGRSLVMLDPKTDTIDEMIDVARKAGVPASRVTIIRPGDISGGVPGWNPLATGLSLSLTTSSFVSILEALYSVLRQIVENIDQIEVLEPPRWSTNANLRGLTRLRAAATPRADLGGVFAASETA